ncbi:ankyrin repeat-containing domain protein, partial [Russula brevipes]
LHLASHKGNVTAARLLLEHEVNVDVWNTMGRTPLHIASQCGFDEMMRLLLDQDAEVDAQDDYHFTTLQLAYGNAEGALLLLEHGAN